MTKSELRKVYLERRTALSKAERTEKSRKIAELFFSTVNLTEISTLHCFIPIERFGEIDTFLILGRLRSSNPDVRLYVPKIVLETGEIESLAFEPGAVLIDGVLGTREPVISKTIDADAIDIVLVPLLCFDRHGFRVGYGKGFYDRFLLRCRPDCLKVGLSYFPPVDVIEDAYSGDVPLDLCITPEYAYRFS